MPGKPARRTTWVSAPFAIGVGGAMVALVTLAVFVFSGKIRSIRSLVAEADVATGRRVLRPPGSAEVAWQSGMPSDILALL
ncbi:MAG: hypothetical protein V3S98_07545 [Dehalococcoidia bacterium]